MKKWYAAEIEKIDGGYRLGKWKELEDFLQGSSDVNTIAKRMMAKYNDILGYYDNDPDVYLDSPEDIVGVIVYNWSLLKEDMDWEDIVAYRRI